MVAAAVAASARACAGAGDGGGAFLLLLRSSPPPSRRRRHRRPGPQVWCPGSRIRCPDPRRPDLPWRPVAGEGAAGGGWDGGGGCRGSCRRLGRRSLLCLPLPARPWLLLRRPAGAATAATEPLLGLVVAGAASCRPACPRTVWRPGRR